MLRRVCLADLFADGHHQLIAAACRERGGCVFSAETNIGKLTWKKNYVDYFTESRSETFNRSR